MATLTGAAKILEELYVSADVCAALDDKLKRFEVGEWEYEGTGEFHQRIKSSETMDGKTVNVYELVIDAAGNPIEKRELKRVVVPQLEMMEAVEAAKQVESISRQRFRACIKLADEAMRLAEVEAPVRTRIINEVISRDDFPVIMRAVSRGKTNINDGEKITSASGNPAK